MGRSSNLEDPAPRPSSSSDGGESDTEELAAPPAYYFVHLKEIYPDSTRRDGLRAWDLHAKESRKSATEQDRVQGAILNMDGVLNSAPAPLPRQGASTSSRKHTIEDSVPSEGGSRTDKGKQKALFISDDDEDPSDIEVDSAPAKKKRRISVVGAARSAKGKGKGKAREADLVLTDDEDGDLVFLPGEGRASSSTANRGGGGKKNAFADFDTPDLSASVQSRIEGSRKARTPTPPPISPLAHLLSLLPDLLPSHAETLLASGQYGGSLDTIVDHLLGIPGGYPKVEEEKEPEKEAEVDWCDLKARQRTEGEKNALYKRLALDQLYTDFPSLPTTVIKSTYLSPEISASFFAPAYLSLYTRSEAGEFESQKLKNRRKPPKKATKWINRPLGDETGAKEGAMIEVEESDEILDKEMSWVKQKLVAQRKANKMKVKLEKAEEAEQNRIEQLNEKARKSGKAIECQCCFDEVASQNTVACEKGHLFCRGCAVNNASHRIGDQKYTLPCMTDCDAIFSSREYSDWLPQKMKDTLERLQADKECEMAFEGIDGFEKCPFCPFAMYIENENERLFTCLNEKECGKVSCRKCKKTGHVPLTCEEADKESRMGDVHAVEDAMAEALIRSCPKCKLRYVKSEACNKITCSKCGTLSCYICGVAVKDYSHFDRSAPGSAEGNSSRCPLFDDTELRHFNEVEEARKKAQATLDPKTAEYAEKLAADKVDRPETGHARPQVVGGPPPPVPDPRYVRRQLPLGAPVYPDPLVGAERALAFHNEQIEEMRRHQRVIMDHQVRLQQALQRAALGHDAQGGQAAAPPAPAPAPRPRGRPPGPAARPAAIQAAPPRRGRRGRR